MNFEQNTLKKTNYNFFFITFISIFSGVTQETGQETSQNTLLIKTNLLFLYYRLLNENLNVFFWFFFVIFDGYIKV